MVAVEAAFCVVAGNLLAVLDFQQPDCAHLIQNDGERIELHSVLEANGIGTVGTRIVH
jgi:hypothetical protein